MMPVYKPAGMTSKDVSRKLTRILGKCKLGHVGTLDPIAEGILPILFGKATRLQDYLHVSSKTYECDVLLGTATDTLDREGEVIEEASFDHIKEEDVLKVLDSFLGEQDQTPPIYSAVKYNGKPLYKYARASKEEEVPLDSLTRRVIIHQLKLIRFQEGSFTFSAEVSKGTYIRVLASDIAKALGTIGHITKLVRSKSSGLSLNETLPLDTILDGLSEGKPLSDFLLPLSKMKVSLDRLRILSSDHVTRLYQGQILSLKFNESFESCDSFSPKGLSSCEEKEVLLEDRDCRLFAIAIISKKFDSFSFKIKKGLV